MNVQEFLQKYGTHSASILLRHLAESAKPAMRETALELANDLESLCQSLAPKPERETGRKFLLSVEVHCVDRHGSAFTLQAQSAECLDQAKALYETGNIIENIEVYLYTIPNWGPPALIAKWMGE